MVFVAHEQLQRIMFVQIQPFKFLQMCQDIVGHCMFLNKAGFRMWHHAYERERVCILDGN